MHDIAADGLHPAAAEVLIHHHLATPRCSTLCTCAHTAMLQLTALTFGPQTTEISLLRQVIRAPACLTVFKLLHSYIAKQYLSKRRGPLTAVRTETGQHCRTYLLLRQVKHLAQLRL